LTVI